MEPERTRKRCAITWAPSATRDPAAQALRLYSTPADSIHLCQHSKQTRAKAAARRNTLKNNKTDIPQCAHSSCIEFGPQKDIIQFVRNLRTDSFTDRQAEAIITPFSFHSYSVKTIVDTLITRLVQSSSEVHWNTPQRRPEWKDDLRFLGEWWITLRGSISATALQAQASLQRDVVGSAVYESMLDPCHRSVATENQLVADLTLRLHEKLFHMDLLHIDQLRMTPDRMHVLLFDGILKLEASEKVEKFNQGSCTTSTSSTHAPSCVVPPLNRGCLKTLSFSICEVSSASLVVLLAGLVHAKSISPCIRSLDISYNRLSCDSWYCLTVMLPMTAIVRLSLRGNQVRGGDSVAFRDFLLEGCQHLVELDLSSVGLDLQQICILIECLSQMVYLRVLLIDGIDIPHHKETALSRAVQKSRLWHISINACAVSQNNICMMNIRNACERNRERDAVGSAAFDYTTSFFEKFFSDSLEKGWRPPVVGALPPNYRPFDTNDPSLVYPGEQLASPHLM